MTLTVCVGASGSGKTTFLNDVYKSHRCIYIRQYHNMRPFITTSKIPNFDPTSLPFWDVYVKEGKADTIKVGGTMAGEFTAGLSGGQRKLLLFELIYQRTKEQSDLLIALDEPFAGVTDDFVDFIVERLNEMRQKHNVLLVTNDHVETLTKMADNTITVSAIDRSNVDINELGKVDREKAIAALSIGDEYTYKASGADLKFFWQTEVVANGSLFGVLAFTAFCNTLFLASFWDSDEDSAVLVLVAGSIIAYFCINPYLLALVDWRNFMTEEAEALLHASKGTNKALKTTLTCILLVVIALVEYGVVNAVIDGLSEFKFLLGILADSVSMTFPLICFGLYTRLPFQAVEIFGSMPFLFMIFFSTTFSPGSGIPVLKELRYLFSRFYWWCMIPGVQDDMENCPPEHLNELYMILSALLGVFLFLCVMALVKVQKAMKKIEVENKRAGMRDKEFVDLQVELYGEKVLRRLNRDLRSSRHSKQSETERI